VCAPMCAHAGRHGDAAAGTDRTVLRRGVPRGVDSDYRTSPVATCPGCGASGAKADFFHSARGLTCEACHKRANAEQRARNEAREGTTDVMLSGLLALAAGAGATLFAALVSPAAVHGRSLGLFGFGVAVAISARMRVAQFPADTPGLRLWRAVANVGAGLAGSGCLMLAAVVAAR
jgi:hypothetical protein